jgi:hypothetical protein
VMVWPGHQDTRHTRRPGEGLKSLVTISPGHTRRPGVAWSPGDHAWCGLVFPRRHQAMPGDQAKIVTRQ